MPHLDQLQVAWGCLPATPDLSLHFVHATLGRSVGAGGAARPRVRGARRRTALRVEARGGAGALGSGRLAERAGLGPFKCHKERTPTWYAW